MAPPHPSSVSLLRFFTSDHLPPSLAEVAEPICVLAHEMAGNTRLSGPELTTGLRKLLEAKDCFVRAALPEET